MQRSKLNSWRFKANLKHRNRRMDSEELVGASRRNQWLQIFIGDEMRRVVSSSRSSSESSSLEEQVVWRQQYQLNCLRRIGYMENEDLLAERTKDIDDLLEREHMLMFKMKETASEHKKNLEKLNMQLDELETSEQWALLQKESRQEHYESWLHEADVDHLRPQKTYVCIWQKHADVSSERPERTTLAREPLKKAGREPPFKSIRGTYLEASRPDVLEDLEQPRLEVPKFVREPQGKREHVPSMRSIRGRVFETSRQDVLEDLEQPRLEVPKLAREPLRKGGLESSFKSIRGTDLEESRQDALEDLEQPRPEVPQLAREPPRKEEELKPSITYEHPEGKRFGRNPQTG
uniref:Uncharacterized protein n=1 Tax=Sphaerodactylus townsendi TaxID=933632 RepID=A0ACB8FTJ9_9SAUR